MEIDSYFFESLNCQDSLAKFDSKKVDIGIVFGTGKLIPEVIDKFSGHLMNIHRGIPQKYRGLDSDLWAIYKNDFDNIGTTLHLVEPDLDTGTYKAKFFRAKQYYANSYDTLFYHSSSYRSCFEGS